tara:strand:- start:128 stop:397 length:270 start_codon:yes stop_codon:yes gene_type:complete
MMQTKVAGLSPRRHTGKPSQWRIHKGEPGVQENDDLPKNMPKPKRDLYPISIEELHQYIAEMQEEIERVRAEIVRKEAHRAGVESIFKS